MKILFAASALAWLSFRAGAEAGSSPQESEKGPDGCFAIAGTVLTEFRERVLARHPAYLVARDRFALACIDYREARASRFPRYSLSLSPSCAFSGAKADARTVSLGTGIGVSRSFPGGTRLAGYFGNSFAMTDSDGMRSSYSPSASLSVQTPLGIASPALLRASLRSGPDPGGIQIRVAYLELSIADDSAVSSAVSALGHYWLAMRDAEIAEERWRLLEQKGTDAFGMWQAGRLTALELSECDAARHDAYAEVIRRQKALLEANRALARNGIAAGDFGGTGEAGLHRIARLLDDLEAVQGSILCPDGEPERKRQELERLRIEAEWQSSLAADLDRLPSTAFTASLVPRSASRGERAVWDSVREYWASEISWNWSASLSVSIPLGPRDPAWDAAERFALESSIHEATERELAIKSAGERAIRGRTLEILREARTYAAGTEAAARVRYELYRSLSDAGRLSAMDMQLQAVAVAEAECDVFRARLEYVLAELGE